MESMTSIGSERKGATSAATTVARRLEALLDARVDGPVVACLISTPDGRATVLPRSWARLTGQSTESALDWGWLDIVRPEDRERVRTAWHEAPLRRSGWHIEWRMSGPDGDERLMHDESVPVIDEGTDELIEWIRRITDVTAARRAETLVVDQRALLEQIASDAPLADILDRMVRALERHFEGMVASVLLLRDGRLRHGAAPHLPARYSAAIDGAAIGPNVGSCGTAAFTRQPVLVDDIANDPRWADYRDLALREGLKACWSTPIFGAGGDVLGTFAMYYRTVVANRPAEHNQDLVVTATHVARVAIERERSREALIERGAQLVEADRRKDEFLAMLSHELRNPLAPIITAVELFEREDFAPEVVRKGSLVVARQARVLNRLVGELLEVSRISRGKIRLEREVLAVSATVLEAVESLRPLLDERRHEVRVELPSVPLYVDADPVRLAQVLSNLLSNAAKYTDPGGHISITVREHAATPGGTPEVDIIVKDSGIGIAGEQLAHVFELFVQAPSALGQARGGLGIGLTLVKRLVELHSGRVSASSEGPGRGSELVVTLPRCDAPSLPVAKDAGKPSASGGPHPATGLPTRARHPHRVVIVDDNTDAAEILQLALERCGHEVRAAGDGPSALALIEAWHPDLVLLDLGLPGMDGYEVAHRLRATAAGKALHLFALTGFGQASDRARTAEAGFERHLVKPVALDELIAAMDEVS